MTGRFTREDWTDLGLDILGREGPEALTVASICTAAERTRGSLYHHFKDINALLVGILRRWQQTHTDALVHQVDQSSPESALSRMNTLALTLDIDVERNVRRLVARRPQLRSLLAETDRRRVDYLTELYRRDARLDRDQSEMLAQIEYAAWIGFQYMEPVPTPERLSNLYRVFGAITRAYGQER